MKPTKGKSNKWLYIGLAVLVVGGVAGYFLYKRNKDKENEGQTGELPPTGETTPQPEPTPQATQKQANDAVAVVKKNNAPVVTKDNPIKTTVVVPSNAPKGTPTGSQPATLVSATDLLAGNPKGANQKVLVAQVGGLPIYNARGEKAGTSTKGRFLGVAYMAKKMAYGNNYRIYFMTAGGVSYNMPDIGVLVKTN